MIRFTYLFTSAALLLLLCTATAIRSTVYIDDVTFWSDTVSKSPDKVRPLVMLGSQLRRAGDDEFARRYFERALELEPDCAEALNDLAIIYNRSNKHDEALEFLLRAVRSVPSSLSYRSNLAMLYYSMGMKDHAADEYKVIIAQAPLSPESAFARQMLHAMGKAAPDEE
jgi:Flp pilus assembly protein TadD